MAKQEGTRRRPRVYNDETYYRIERNSRYGLARCLSSSSQSARASESFELGNDDDLPPSGTVRLRFLKASACSIGLVGSRRIDLERLLEKFGGRAGGLKSFGVFFDVKDGDLDDPGRIIKSRSGF